MKLSQAKQNAAQSESIATITIYQPNDQPYLGSDGKEATISFRGQESKRYRAKQQEIADRQIAQGKRRLTREENLAVQVELAACVVESWTGWEDDNDQPLPATFENVVELLSTEHVLVQVQVGIARHAHFFVMPSPS